MRRGGIGGRPMGNDVSLGLVLSFEGVVSEALDRERGLVVLALIDDAGDGTWNLGSDPSTSVALLEATLIGEGIASPFD
jgi:hypothetical protein